ncbi:thioesterase family protein [Sphaerisporangium sp. TRM90804]|uniref:thioesterase family protein n=1 Tax=Sphaerisporangium sp. TRM90804 TaxID=3031113 RepID=UPI00244C8BFF|nr:thioesterase family protein [Sphaerisporangium sp. TRM90804]MDH2430189.1 thioesterase family protein [Sphaerisporangium sp. TRM90804]
MGTFSEATRLVAREGTTDRREFGATLDPQWAIGDKPHGGYLLSVLSRAASEAAGERHPHLTAIGGSFLEAPAAGPADVRVEILREGRGATQVRARLSQDGRPCVEALITLGRLETAGSWWSSGPPVELPAERDCLRAPPEAPGADFRVPLMEVVELRLDPAQLGFAFGAPAREGRLSGWWRLADGSDWDPASLLVALDPAPPVSFELGLGGWVPTIQFSASIRRLPAPGPVRAAWRTMDVSNDRMDQTTHVWDEAGLLVGQSSQIHGVRIPAAL